MDQTPASLRLELFVRDVAAETDFYVRVLGFDRITTDQEGYIPLRPGDVAIALADIAWLPGGHPLRPSSAQERLGIGVEIVIEVDDGDAAFDRAWETGIRSVGPSRNGRGASATSGWSPPPGTTSASPLAKDVRRRRRT